MKWITRAHVHVDRVACPWLIQRFIDSKAEFIFAANNQVMATAESEKAIPFDIQGVELGHHGDKCSFVSMMEKYNLTDPALMAMAKMVNAADTGNMKDSPYAAGLEAVTQGFSLMFPDDNTNLEKQWIVYDALYAFFKLNHQS
jgi:hypothetical protein